MKHVERVVWDCPLAIFDIDWPAYQTEIEQLLDLGFRRFRLQNLSQFALFNHHEGLSLESGYRLFTTNSQAACAWHELGLDAAMLYVEDDRQNMSAVLNRQTGIPLSATVYANLPMMISRIPLQAIKRDRPIVSDRGETYRVDNRSGLTIVKPEQDYSLLGHLGELQALGCRRFVLDLSHLTPGSAEQRRILQALRQDQPVAGASSFNFKQEMV